jgi:putative ABC transport system permease protein
MDFLILIFKNIFRQKIRTALTVLGISIGIATIVALGIITEGLKDSMEGTLTIGASDFMVAQAGSADLILSTVTHEQLKGIEEIKGVERAVGVLISVIPVKSNPYFMVMGIKNDALEAAEINLYKGRAFQNQSEVILGKIAASNLKAKIGGTFKFNNETFKIVGLYETGNPFIDGGAFVDLSYLQKMQKKEGQYTMAFVQVEKGFDPKKIAKKIEDEYKEELVAITSASDYEQVDQGLKIIDAASWAISLLAILIGGIGVMNAIMMSVFERTREIGILRAIGWKRRRVLKMILGESIAIGFLATLVGIVLGIGGVKLIMLSPAAKSFLEPSYSLITFEKAVVVALLVSFLGGLYPAYRATKFRPVEAIRYE